MGRDGFVASFRCLIENIMIISWWVNSLLTVLNGLTSNEMASLPIYIGKSPIAISSGASIEMVL